MTRKKTEAAKAAAAEDRKAKAAAKQADAEIPVDHPVDHVVVTTKRGVASRWRGGRNFGPEPVLIPIEDLDDDGFAALEADPALVVALRSK